MHAPQKDYRARAANALMVALTKVPSIRKDFYARRIKPGMVKPLQDVVEKK